MGTQEPTPEDVEAEKIWRVAETARQLAMRAALRDKSLWRNQLLNVSCGLVKALCIAVVLSIGLISLGLPKSFCVAFGVMVVAPFAVFNPKAFFWRNLFSEHADCAFDFAIKNYNVRKK